ncbi:MAG: type II toxin-antitoxin system RelE/ParE family toxin [Neorhizobium sp.]|nr:type II toxin-antitoxin system RelE/ParE family toxin [Neorhizobium sp.]
MTQNEVLFHPLADIDLETIYHFIAADSPDRAIAFVRRIRAFSMNLKTMSMRGRNRDDLASGVRTLVFEKRVVIAYRTESECVTVLRLFYAGRNISDAIWPD